MPAQRIRIPLCAALLGVLALVVFCGSPAYGARSTEQISGASGSGTYTDMGGASADGRHVVFMTDKPLDPADTDTSVDVYENFNGVNRLVSTGPSGGNGSFPASFDFISQDGSKIVFETSESLVPIDTDNSRDVYMRSGGVTTLVSRGPAGTNAADDAYYEGASADGNKIFFGTVESLVSADTDTFFDTYMRLNGTSAVLITTGSIGGNGAFPAEFDGASQDGTHVFFETTEKLTSADTDNTVDIYDRFGNTTTLLSAGPTGGNGNVSVMYNGASTDGSKVFFTTGEQLTSADTDTGQDIYQASGGTTTLLTSGTAPQNDDYGGATPDGSHVFFQSQGRLTAADNDSFIDVYDANGGTIKLVSTGHNDVNGAANTYFLGASADASHVIIRTDEPLVAADTDTNQDIYDVSGGVETLVSTGPAGGNGALPAIYSGTSDDGSRVFFETAESLVSSDTDTTTDVYERSGGTTTLLSTGSTGGNAAVDARFRGATPDGGRVFIGTPEALASGDTDSANDIYASSLPGQVVIKKDAVPDDPQDFTFTIGGGLSLGLAAPPGQTTFQLDDDADPTLSNTQTFPNVAPGAGYSVTESPTPGWDAAGATCDNGSTPGSIQVDAGKTTTCTFTNNKRGKIVAAVANTPTGDPQAFSFTAGGGLSPSSFSLDDNPDPTLSNTQTFANVAPGSGYSLAESVPSGWDLTSATCSNGSPVSNINVSPNETVTCTFNNRKRGSLVVIANSTPQDAQDFSFSAGGGLTPPTFQLDDDSDPTLSNTRTFTNLLPSGGYSIAETIPSGWDLTGATCDNGNLVSNINVTAGQTVTCTFSNRKRGKILAVTDSQPNDAQDFAYTAGGGLSPTSFALDDDSDPTLSNTQTFNNVVPGSGFTLAQGSTPSGWDPAGSSCDNGSAVSNISVAAGQTVTCTFVNKKRGTLVVIKDAVPDSSQDFSFTAAGGLSPSTFTLDDDATPTLSNTETFSDVQAKSGYSVAESVPNGWFQDSATCSDGSPVSNIDIAPGETVTCTFVNSRRAQLTIVKDAQPNDPQDFSFSANNLNPSSFLLDDDNNNTLSNIQNYTNLNAGMYSVSEAPVSGWDQSSATCSDGSPVSAIDLSAGESVTCTFVNQKHGSITIVEASQPSDPQDFSYTAGGGLSPTSFSLDDDADPTLSNTRTFANLSAASGYSLAQSAVAGWTSTATCSDGSPISNIDVSPGENVTCTFTNKRNGTIVAVKSAQPSDPQDFSFNAGGGLSPSSFALDDDSDPTLSNTRTFSNVAPQSGYSLSESVPSGWDQTGAICNDGSQVSNINVSPSETVTCTFTNRKRGKIVLVANSQPNDPQDFSFLTSGGLSPSSFSLDDDSDPTLSNTVTFNNVVPGSYGISETVPSGWDQTGATCDNGSPLSTIDVSAGETVTCTVTNRKRGKVVVVKDSQPNDPQDFSFTAGGGLSPTSFLLDDDSDPTLSNTQTFNNVIPGAGYSVAETVPSGWDQTIAACDDGSPPSSIDVSPGETVNCTFTNTKHGSLTIVKNAQPNDPQAFSFTVGGGLSPSSFSLDDNSDPALPNSQTFDDITAGTYSASESPVAGWDLSSATCDNGSPVSAINISPGANVTCTFTNQKRGQVVVVENSVPNDPQDFSFTAGGGLSPSSFSLDDDSDPTLSNTRTFSNVAVGSYSLSENVPAGWGLSSATCDNGSSISHLAVGPGETVTCTFTNKRAGQIIAVKDAQPNDPQGFSFTAGGGLSPSSFQLDDNSDPTLSNMQSFSDLTPGSGYSLSESVPSGWDQTGASCDDGSPPSNIDVSAGETVTCTFTNRKRGKIVIVKQAFPNDAQDFAFTAGGGLSPSSFSLDDDADPTLSNTQTFNDVAPGSGYSFSESVPTGWTQDSATCSDSSPVTNVDVSAGETVTCTFVNVHGYPRPKGATPFRVSLVPSYNGCVSPNSTHGAPLDYPSCKPPVQTSTYLTVGSSDSNGKPANMIGSMRWDVILGNPSTPANEADARIAFNISDVRNSSDLSDYTGQLGAVASVRSTDRQNGPGTDEPGTVSDFPFQVTAPCTATSSTNTGSVCSLVTTANTVIPGAIVETQRTVWELGAVQVVDGGADGSVSTPDNTVFARQGVFVP